VAGAATLVLLHRAAYGRARLSAAIAVVAVLFGWATGQYPYMLEHSLRISDAAGAHATLVAILVVLGAGSVLLVPALVWLFVLMQRGVLVHEV
jgi:cytochrome d ubiquinol oxidase subunit II